MIHSEHKSVVTSVSSSQPALGLMNNLQRLICTVDQVYRVVHKGLLRPKS